MTLYELKGSWMELYDMADDPDMDADMWFDTMEAIDGEIEEKADAYAMLRANFQNDIEGIKKEEARLYARRKAIENKVERMMHRLQEVMEETGKTKFKTALFSFGIRNNAPSVVLDCKVEELPEELLKRPEPSADKVAIKKILESGTPFPFAHLEAKRSLHIR